MRNIILAILLGTPLNNRHFVFLLFLRKYIFSCEGFTIVDQDINNSSLKVMVAEMLLKMKDNWNFPTTCGHRRSLSVLFACYKVPS